MTERQDAEAEALWEAAREKWQEQVVACERSIVGMLLGNMKGRRASGFTSAGYHEPSCLYGVARGEAERLGVEMDSYAQMLAEAQEVARKRFMKEVEEVGIDAFEHPNAGKRSANR